MKKILKYIALAVSCSAMAISCHEDSQVSPEAKPKVVSLLPKAGYPGTEAVISGYGFSEPLSVEVDGAAVSVSEFSVDRIYFTMPEHELGQVEVIVKVGDVQLRALPFRYAEPVEEEKLAVFSYNPASGIEGDQIAISGRLFSNKKERNSVTINGKECTVEQAGDTRLIVTLPDNPAGKYPFVITVDGETVTGPLFTYSNKPDHIYTVTTISGSAGRAADAVNIVDGGSSVARFRQPRGVIFLPEGRMAILDNGNNAVRFMDATTGEVTGHSTATKNISNAAWRGALHGEWIYYASKGNNKMIRYNYKTDVAEVVSAVFAGTSPMDVAFDAAGNGYLLVRDGSKAIYKASGDDFSSLSTFASFDDGPLAMEFDPEGNLVVTTNGCQVIGVKPDGTKFVIAGIRAAKADDDGTPGEPLTAKFGSNILGVTVDSDGNIYVADDSFKVIKRITRGERGYEDAVVSTIAGKSGVSGKDDGAGANATFNSPGEIRMDASGKFLIVTEYNAYTVRKIVID